MIELKFYTIIEAAKLLKMTEDDLLALMDCRLSPRFSFCNENGIPPSGCKILFDSYGIMDWFLSHEIEYEQLCHDIEG